MRYARTENVGALDETNRVTSSAGPTLVLPA
jgi:hypothetical protein